MKVNFNNVRLKAIRSYSRLCRTLNSEIHDGDLTVTPEEIQHDMDDLRDALVTIACCYQEGDEGFEDISDKIGDVPSFNEEPEDI